MDESRNALNKQGGWIAFMLCGMLGFCLWALVFREVPEANQNALLVVIGILSGALGVVVNFYFGSTSTSKKQQETIGTLADTAKSAQAALPAVNGANVIPVAPGDSVVVKADDPPQTV